VPTIEPEVSVIWLNAEAVYQARIVNKVAIRWRATGTQRGDGLGVKPTGRSMAITGMSIVRVRDGLIVEGWNNFDVLGMHRQVGTLSQL
jgi:predicted ester cyclase